MKSDPLHNHKRDFRRFPPGQPAGHDKERHLPSTRAHSGTKPRSSMHPVRTATAILCTLFLVAACAGDGEPALTERVTAAIEEHGWPELTGEVWEAMSVSALDDILSEQRVGSRTDNGLSALMFAARHNADPDVASYLIEAGAGVNARDGNGLSALMHAAERNESAEVVRTLLDAGADVHATDDGHGSTVLMRAAGWNTNPRIVELIIEAGAEVNERNARGHSALILAAMNNESNAVLELLLDAGAEVDAVDDQGRSALMWAARASSNSAVVEALIEAGADGQRVCDDGMTARDYIEGNDTLEGTDAYWQLNDLRYE